jgi:hypothetical protein
VLEPSLFMVKIQKTKELLSLLISQPLCIPNARDRTFLVINLLIMNCGTLMHKRIVFWDRRKLLLDVN